MKRYVIAVDEGTTSARAMLFDAIEKKFVAEDQRSIKQIYPRPSWVEEDADEIYVNTLSAIVTMCEKADSVNDVKGIGITNQRETVIAWDRETGRPVYNAIVWQCRRTSEYCKTLSDERVNVIKEKTGLKVDAYFSATKIKWILDNVEKARELMNKGRLCVGTVDSFLIYKLTGNFYTDMTNASRTMLFNLHTLSWDDELLDFFGIPKAVLPEIKRCDDLFGYFTYEGRNIPVTGVLGDQQAALYGQDCLTAGSGKITYGTGLFMLFSTGKEIARSKSALSTVGFADKNGVAYALEGSVFNAGSAVQWLRDGLGLFENSADTEEMAKSVPDTGGVYVVPAFTGLGAPYWRGDVTGLITGITRGTNKNHITRAVLESIAYSAKAVLCEIEKDCGFAVKEIKVDGGASANDFLMQFQADILNVKIDRPTERESTALGAAKACAVSLGLIDFESAKEIRKSDKVFTPSDDREKYSSLYEGYKKAVERCLL